MSDVREWLDSLGLAQYADAFEENAIEFDVVSDLTEEDFETLGVKLGHRKRLLRAVATTGGHSPTVPASVIPVPTEPLDETFAAWHRHPGERKTVTMLFADVTESTALTEKLDSEEAHELLYGATQRMCQAVERYRGTVCRFMGDGLMAMFGAPVASERHALDACEAALDMQWAIRDYAGEVESQRGSGLKIRVGLHSGEVVVLTVGEGDKLEYDASGPTVPVAARMEQAAKPGEVYLTGATHSLCARYIDTETLPPVAVKGISEPVPVFTLRRVRLAEEARSAESRTPFVGRRATLRQLQGLLDSCIEDRQGQTVHVRGEPGIGKTRLVEEFTRVALEMGVSCHRGLTLPFGVGKGQDAVRLLVRSLLAIAPGGDMKVRTQAAQEALTSGLIGPNQAVFLNDFLDLPQPKALQGRYDAMDNATRTAGQRATLASLVASVSRQGPTLIVVEDVHWADANTLSHLSALARAVAECAALLVLTSRIEGDPLDRQWMTTTRGSPFVMMELGPLRTEDSLALIRAFIDTSGELAATCLERAAGNPLFLEQLIRNAKEGTDQSLPDSIRSLVLARLDRLEPESKRALQTAAVIGQRFRGDALDYLLGVRGYDCGELIQHNLIRPEGDGFLFAHALIQEGVYSSLLKRQRQELHRRAAEWFKSSDLSLRAGHLEHAGEPSAAEAFLEAAHDQARQYRFDASVGLVERGLRLPSSQPARHGLICARGQYLQDLGEPRASVCSYEEALTQAEDEAQRVEALIGLGAGMRILTDYSVALEYLDRAEPFAAKLEMKAELSRLHYLRGNLYFSLGRSEECFAEHRQAFDYARDCDSAESEAQALGALGDAEYARGRMQSSCDYFRRCLDRCAEHGFVRIEVANRAQMGLAMAYCGEYRAACDGARVTIEDAHRVGHRRAEMNGYCCLAYVLVEMGEWKPLLDATDRCLSFVEELGARGLEPLVLALQAIGLVKLGRRRDAMNVLHQAALCQQEAGSAGFTGGHVYGAMLIAAEHARDRDEALRRGRELLTGPCIAHVPMSLHRYRIEACLEAGEWDQAENAVQGLEAFARIELFWVNYFAAWGRALAAFGRGQRNDGLSAELERLRDEADSVGLGSALPALHRALGAA
jgi:class 3 adenylate cyclase/tetratricopeptide (TPR) repeat protein